MDLMSPFPIPLCDPAISPDFLTTITTFRIIVLTYNRPESLYRLLTSIKNADYSFKKNNPNWNLTLDIRIDVGAGEKGEEVQRLARRFRFPQGRKEIHVEPEHRGIDEAWPWRHAWAWTRGELFIVLEDDVEVSRHWYRATVNMWQRYGSHPHLAGITLEYPAFVIIGGEQPIQNISSRVSGPVFMYALGSSKGFSPHPCHWRRMIQLYGDNLGDCPPGHACHKQVWESWWTIYHRDNLLYTLYSADQGAFAVDHRAVGYHLKQSTGKLCDLITNWNEKREKENLPETLEMLDLQLEKNFGMAKVGWLTSSLADKYSVILLRQLTNDEEMDGMLQELKKQNITVTSSDEDLMSRTMFVVSSERYEEKLKEEGVKNIATLDLDVESIIKSKQNETLTNNFKKNFFNLVAMLQVISQKDITQNQDLKVVSVPIELAFDAFPLPRRQIMNPIAAGKLKGQHHPRLDYLFMDGSDICYKTLLALLKKIIRERRESLDFNLFSSLSSAVPNSKALWQWV